MNESIGVLKNWKKGKGVKAGRHETNHALAERDYSIKCERGSDPIIIFEGYWIWWCITHQQPMHVCEISKFKKQISTIREVVRDDKHKE